MLNLTSLEVIKELLWKYHLRPNTDIGQHFLVSSKPIEDMLEAGEVTKEDAIIEIGPGLGVLTVALARRAKRVVAVEKDRKVAKVVKKILKGENISNVEIIEGDILRDLLYTPPATGYKLISNLPYQITSVVLRKFLECEPKPTLLALMVQKEVAERVTAPPGEMSLLSVSVQFYADAQIFSHVLKKDFYPIPEIDSAILKIVPRQTLLLPLDEVRNFFWLVRVGFSARRKMLKNNLAGGLQLTQEKVQKLLNLANISKNVRAQELSISDWIRLLLICQINVDKRKDF